MTQSKPQTSRNSRVTRHLQLVAPIAQHYARRSGQDRDDLFQVGCLGLIRASALFQSQKAIPFECFARPHIRGAILHYLRDSMGLVRLPRRIQEQAQRSIEREQSKGLGNRQQEATAEERWAVHAYRLQGHWEQLNESGISFSTEERHPVGWSELVRDEQRRALQHCWNQLTAMERQCVRRVVIHGQSLRRTAKELGTSPMTVQRRVKGGLGCLARHYRDGCQRSGSNPISPEHHPERSGPQAC